MDRYPVDRPVTLELLREWWQERYEDGHAMHIQMTEKQYREYEALLDPVERVVETFATDHRERTGLYYKGSIVWYDPGGYE